MTNQLSRLTEALEGYVIERELGQGGMATVYLADDVRHHRKVAIKVLHPELSAVLGSDRFLREIQLTANLQHPNILPLFDSGSADGLLYYVMPFIEGQTLRERLEHERQLPVADAIRIASEAAEALEYAHSRHVIHRDIKPENILLQGGRPLIADFGIALAVQEAGGNRMTQTGLSLGTPQYMSPEQATGERDIDARSDIYSLGAVTYEMLTGEPPFTGPSSQAIVAKVITTEPPRLIPKRKSVPPHVEQAVLVALEKTPADRFGSALDFARALNDQSFGAGRTTLSSSSSPDRRTRPWREVAVGAIAIALVAVAGMTVTLLRAEKSTGVTRFSVTLDQQPAAGAGDVPAVSPDGSHFVYTNDDGMLVVKDREALRGVAIAAAADGWAPFISPDSKTLGFFTGFPGALKTVSLAGGPATTLVRDSTYGQGGAWSEDGWIYYTGFVKGHVSLMRVRATGGTPEVIAVPDTARDELFYEWPSVLPGNKALLFSIARRKGPWDIAAIDLKNRTIKVIGRGVRGVYAPSGHLVTILGDGSVLATRFNPRKLETKGKTVPVLSGVLTASQGRMPFAFSRSGTLLYEASDRGQQVVRVMRDGEAHVVDPQWTGQFQHVSVSPDGKRLAVGLDSPDGRTELWVKDLVDGALTRVAAEGTYNYRPAWTADGRRILFISDRSGSGQLYEVPADGSGPATPVLIHPKGVDEGAWSKDGRWLTVRIGSGGARDIAVKGAGDSSLRMLVAGDAQEFSPIVSPDGRWIAYGSDESGQSQVYVRPFPDARNARWQISRAGGTEPVWSQDGRELFYRNAAGELVAAEVATSSNFAIVRQRALFNAKNFVADTRNRSYSVAPDGQSFYFVRVPEARIEYIVVLNWFEELEAKAGR